LFLLKKQIFCWSPGLVSPLAKTKERQHTFWGVRDFGV
jgi:hypothetical protein